jgi:hypothetical protein
MLPSTLITLENLYKLPNHFKVFQWPLVELKKLGIMCDLKTHRRYILRQTASLPVVGRADVPVNVELCCIAAINSKRETNYEKDVAAESSFTMPLAVFNKVKHLVSSTYGEQVEKEKKEARRKFIESYIPVAETKIFATLITREFCTDLFGDVSFLNIDMLSTSAITDLQNSAYWFYNQFLHPTNPKVAVSDEKER